MNYSFIPFGRLFWIRGLLGRQKSVQLKHKQIFKQACWRVLGKNNSKILRKIWLLYKSMWCSKISRISFLMMGLLEISFHIHQWNSSRIKILVCINKSLLVNGAKALTISTYKFSAALYIGGGENVEKFVMTGKFGFFVNGAKILTTSKWPEIL